MKKIIQFKIIFEKKIQTKILVQALFLFKLIKMGVQSRNISLNKVNKN